jgi:hypothetical protein
LNFAARLRAGHFQQHQLATHSPAIDSFAFFSASVRIRPFCGAGPASPAFRLVDPHAPPLPFLPAGSYLLIAHHQTPPAPLSLFNNKSRLPSSSKLFPTFADNKSLNHTA